MNGEKVVQQQTSRKPLFLFEGALWGPQSLLPAAGLAVLAVVWWWAQCVCLCVWTWNGTSRRPCVFPTLPDGFPNRERRRKARKRSRLSLLPSRDVVWTHECDRWNCYTCLIIYILKVTRRFKMLGTLLQVEKSVHTGLCRGVFFFFFF